MLHLSHVESALIEKLMTAYLMLRTSFFSLFTKAAADERSTIKAIPAKLLSVRHRLAMYAREVSNCNFDFNRRCQTDGIEPIIRFGVPLGCHSDILIGQMIAK